MVFFGFYNWWGWFAFLSLLFLVILYMIRPRPKDVDMPSLMFWEKNLAIKSKRGFFRRFIRDPLFLIQILILLLLSLFFVEPFVELKDVSTENVIFVIDVSASMNNVFGEGKDYALDRIGASNTLISAGSDPYVLLEKGDSGDAKKLIKNLGVSSSRSAIAESLQLALDKSLDVGGEKKIVVVSDFIDTEDGSIKNVLNSVKGQGVVLDVFEFSKEKRENVGIVSFNAGDKKSEIVVKNFCCGEKDFSIDINGEKTGIKLGEGDTKNIDFETPKGKSVIKLEVDDDFAFDDSVYISNPVIEKTDVVLLTNDASIYLTAALQASDDINLDVKKPLSSNIKDYDVYVLHNVGNINNNFAEKIKKKLEEGRSVVIHAEDGVTGDYNGVLDFKINKLKDGGESSILQNSKFTQGISFGGVDFAYGFNCGDSCGSVFLEVKEEPLIFINAKKGGKIGYYGIMEESSGFKTTPDYPLFWVRFVEYLAGYGGINSLNTKTGNIISFDSDVEVEYPDGKKSKKDIILMNEAGFYDIEGVVYSANLVDDKESNLNNFYDVEGFFKEGKVNQKIKKEVWKGLVIIALILMVVEYFMRILKNKRRKYYA